MTLKLTYVFQKMVGGIYDKKQYRLQHAITALGLYRVVPQFEKASLVKNFACKE